MQIDDGMPNWDLPGYFEIISDAAFQYEYAETEPLRRYMAFLLTPDGQAVALDWFAKRITNAGYSFTRGPAFLKNCDATYSLACNIDMDNLPLDAHRSRRLAHLASSPAPTVTILEIR